MARHFRTKKKKCFPFFFWTNRLQVLQGISVKGFTQVFKIWLRTANIKSHLTPEVDFILKVSNSSRRLASKGFPSGYLKSVYVCACTQKLRTYDVHFSNDAWRMPPDTTALRWPAFITLSTLAAKFQLVWRRLCDVIMLIRSSCLFEYTLTAVCALSPSISLVVNIMCIHTFCDHLMYFIFSTKQICIVLKSGWSPTARMLASLLVLLPSLPLTPRCHRQADG